MFSLMAVRQPDAIDQEAAEMIRAALRRAYAKQEAAACDLQKDPAQFSRELASGRLPISDLFRLDAQFWHEWIPLVARRFGVALPHERASLSALCQAVDKLTSAISLRGMARMSLDRRAEARQEKVS